MSNKNQPKVFISYDESRPEYVEKVELFVEKIRKSGIEVIFDRTCLKPGQDINQFVEDSINDPSTTHVIMLLNKEYAEKANSRTHGVGKESQIISEKVYDDPKQTKFVPIVFEKGSGGTGESLPIYLKSRFYMDLTDEKNYEQNFEKLVYMLNEEPEKTASLNGKSTDYPESESTISFEKKDSHFKIVNSEALRSLAERIVVHPEDGIPTIRLVNVNNKIQNPWLEQTAKGIYYFFQLMTRDCFFAGVWHLYCMGRAQKEPMTELMASELKLFCDKYGSETVKYYYYIKYSVEMVSRILDYDPNRDGDYEKKVLFDAWKNKGGFYFVFGIDASALSLFCEENLSIDFTALTTIPEYGYYVADLDDSMICEDVAPAFFVAAGKTGDFFEKNPKLLDFSVYSIGLH